MYAQSFRQGDDGSIGPIGSTRMPDAVTHHTCIKTQTEYELSLILKEIRFITDQVSFLVLGIYIKNRIVIWQECLTENLKEIFIKIYEI